jgi:hypothetical protein
MILRGSLHTTQAVVLCHDCHAVHGAPVRGTRQNQRPGKDLSARAVRGTKTHSGLPLLSSTFCTGLRLPEGGCPPYVERGVMCNRRKPTALCCRRIGFCAACLFSRLPLGSHRLMCIASLQWLLPSNSHQLLCLSVRHAQTCHSLDPSVPVHYSPLHCCNVIMFVPPSFCFVPPSLAN